MTSPSHTPLGTPIPSPALTPPGTPPPPAVPKEAVVGEITINGKVYEVRAIFKDDKGIELDIPDDFENPETLEKTYQIGTRLQELAIQHDEDFEEEDILKKITSDGFTLEGDNEIAFNEQGKTEYQSITRDLIKCFTSAFENDEAIIDVDLETHHEESPTTNNTFANDLIEVRNAGTEKELWETIADEIDLGTFDDYDDIVDLMKGLKNANGTDFYELGNGGNHQEHLISQFSDKEVVSDFVNQRLASLGSDKRVGDASFFPEYEEEDFSDFDTHFKSYLEEQSRPPVPVIPDLSDDEIGAWIDSNYERFNFERSRSTKEEWIALVQNTFQANKAALKAEFDSIDLSEDQFKAWAIYTIISLPRRS